MGGFWKGTSVVDEEDEGEAEWEGGADDDDDDEEEEVEDVEEVELVASFPLNKEPCIPSRSIRSEGWIALREQAF